ncbi:hypothetical protein ACIO3O_09830 [Streptomyces sp. NPDC087440]|uniref:hypothetical protein n=1 Tax=Streptomyces sp. NPDC087440 TaxID=3365790 RepID=UPI0038299D95
MLITEDVIRRAWRELADRSDALGACEPPLTTTDPDYYEEHEQELEERLLLVVRPDGTVCGMDGSYREVFTSRDLDEVLYHAADDALRIQVRRDAAQAPGTGTGTDAVASRAELLDRVDPAWGRRFRAVDEGAPEGCCAGDPLEGLAWIADGWQDQYPYTSLDFYRGDGLDAADVALALGADPDQVADGFRLSDLRAKEKAMGRAWSSDDAWQHFCFGQAGDWVFFLNHEVSPGGQGFGTLGVTESVYLSACTAKAIYTFDLMRDGRRIADDENGVIELIWYHRGRAPYVHGGPLDFLNRAVRRAELAHPELTEFEIYFHALETSLGISVPRTAFQEGTVRAAQWARPVRP